MTPASLVYGIDPSVEKSFRSRMVSFERFAHVVGLTHPEAVAVSVLVILFVTGTGLRFVIENGSPFDEAYYREPDSVFAALSEGLPGSGQSVVVDPSGAVRFVTATDTGEHESSSAVAPAGADSAVGLPGAPDSARSATAVPGIDSGPPGMNLNRASEGQLQRLPGIGPVLAGRIAAYRTLRGGYARVEDLLEVSGIGPRTLERIRPHLFVEIGSSPVSPADADSASSGETSPADSSR